MKKLFVLFMIVVFALPAMANPFSDVPFSHWAYDAVAKLSSKGLITGFPDGTFRGNKTMTRYELAMVVARLLAKIETPKGMKVSDRDMAVVEKLTVEFADELALLGVKVTALEDEVAVVKDDVAMLKDKVSNIGMGGDNGKIRFSGAIEMRMENNTYKKSATTGILSPSQANVANGNSFTGVNNARTVAQTNENTTNFRTKVKLFLDANIDENISMHTEIRNRIANAQYDAWGSAAHSADDQFTTDVYEGYVKVKDFFGWADSIKFGRQYYGVAHGMMFTGTFCDECDCSSQDCDINRYGYDGITVYKRFTDVTAIDVYGLRTDNDANTGLNVMGITFNFDIEKNLNLKVYYANRSDNQIMDPANGADYTDVAGIGAALIASQNANYALNHDNPTKVQYYGLAVSGDIVRDLTYYGEFAVMDFLDTILDPDDFANWVDSIGPQKAFLLGLKWQANKELKVTLEYRSIDEYYRPINSGAGLYGAAWTDADCMGDTEYDNLGYSSDFRDMFVKVDYALSEKTNIVLTYEGINDTNSVVNRKDDDMSVWTLGFGYKYKPNTMLKLYWKQYDVESHTNGETGTSLPNYFNDANNNGVYDIGVDALNLHDAAQEDHSQVRCELSVKF